MTTRDPLLTTNRIEESAVACECPAVVQCPYHGLLRGLQPSKQHTHVEVIAMEVVQVNDVRLFYVRYQCFGGTSGSEPMPIEQFGNQNMGENIGPGAYPQRRGGTGPTGTAIGNGASVLAV